MRRVALAKLCGVATGGLLLAASCAKTTEDTSSPGDASSSGGASGAVGSGGQTLGDGQWFGGAAGTGSGGAAGTAAGGSGGSGTHCSDGVKDADESDVDCGGSCSPCSLGKACSADGDCAPASCVSGICCNLTKYDKTTGDVSGSGDICCDSGDTRASYSDCAVGANHGVDPLDPNCAHAWEGAGNGGTACATVHCQHATCS